MADDLLRIYLNDQLAAGVGIRELARRTAGSNEGTELGDVLERVADEFAEDVETLEGIIEELGFQRNRFKTTAALVGERAGRFKLNGRIKDYSPLSRFMELDILSFGLDGKRQLWENLRDLAGLAERLPDVDFDALIQRARQQRDLIEPFRTEAGADAIAAG